MVQATLRREVVSGEDIHRGTSPLRDHCEYLFPYLGGEDLVEMAVDGLRGAGFSSTAVSVEECERHYRVSRCEVCGKYPATAYHCDQRLCPRCYYRQLERFFSSHRKALGAMGFLTVFSVDWGLWKKEDLGGALGYCLERHRALLARFVDIKGGIYHTEVQYDSSSGGVRVLYHYLVDCHQNTIFFIMLALLEEAKVTRWRSFRGLPECLRYFGRHCCAFPVSVLLDPDMVGVYLEATRHRRLIQGFGNCLKVSGGRGKGKREKAEKVCPWCGGKLHYVGLVEGSSVSWDSEVKCWGWQPPRESAKSKASPR